MIAFHLGVGLTPTEARPARARVTAPQIVEVTVSPSSLRLGDLATMIVTRADGSEGGDDLERRWRMDGALVPDADGETLPATREGALSAEVRIAGVESSWTASAPVVVGAALAAPSVGVSLDQPTLRAGAALGSDVTATVVVVDAGEPALSADAVALSWLVDGASAPSGRVLAEGEAASALASWAHETGAGSAASAPVVVGAALAAPSVGVSLDQPALRAGAALGSDVTATVVVVDAGEPALSADAVALSWLVDGASAPSGRVLAEGETASALASWAHETGAGSAASAPVVVGAALAAPVVAVSIDGGVTEGDALGADVTATAAIVDAGEPAIGAGDVTLGWVVDDDSVSAGFVVAEGQSVAATASWPHPTGDGAAVSDAVIAAAAVGPEDPAEPEDPAAPASADVAALVPAGATVFWFDAESGSFRDSWMAPATEDGTPVHAVFPGDADAGTRVFADKTTAAAPTLRVVDGVRGLEGVDADTRLTIEMALPSSVVDGYTFLFDVTIPEAMPGAQRIVNAMHNGVNDHRGIGIDSSGSPSFSVGGPEGAIQLIDTDVDLRGQRVVLGFTIKDGVAHPVVQIVGEQPVSLPVIDLEGVTLTPNDGTNAGDIWLFARRIAGSQTFRGIIHKALVMNRGIAAEDWASLTGAWADAPQAPAVDPYAAPVVEAAIVSSGPITTGMVLDDDVSYDLVIVDPGGAPGLVHADLAAEWLVDGAAVAGRHALSAGEAVALRVSWDTGVHAGALTTETLIVAAAESAPAQTPEPVVEGDAAGVTVTLAAAPEDGGSPITHYEWRLADAADAAFAAPVSSGFVAPGALTTPVRVEPLPAGRYAAQARAVNAVGAGLWSDVSSVAVVGPEETVAPEEPVAPASADVAALVPAGATVFWFDAESGVFRDGARAATTADGAPVHVIEPGDAGAGRVVVADKTTAAAPTLRVVDGVRGLEGADADTRLTIEMALPSSVVDGYTFLFDVTIPEAMPGAQRIVNAMHNGVNDHRGIGIDSSGSPSFSVGGPEGAIQLVDTDVDLRGRRVVLGFTIKDGVAYPVVQIVGEQPVSLPVIDLEGVTLTPNDGTNAGDIWLFARRIAGSQTFRGIIHKALVMNRGIAAEDWRMLVATWADAGLPPVAAQPTLALTAYEGVQADDVLLPALFSNAVSFAVTDGALPPGVTLAGDHTEGTPTATGIFSATVTAASPSGLTASATLVYDVRAVPAVAQSDEDAVAVAFDAGVGETVTFDRDFIFAKRHLIGVDRHLGENAGDMTLTVAGVVDFRGAPDLSAIEWSIGRYQDFITESGGEPERPETVEHPIWGGGAMVGGPTDSEPLAVDHDPQTGRSLGLRPPQDAPRDLWGWQIRWPGDTAGGHLVWLVEAVLPDGALIHTWSEQQMTRTHATPLRWPLDLIYDHVPWSATEWTGTTATWGDLRAPAHIRRIVMFRVKSWAEAAVPALSNNEPRSWITPAKRWRSQYTPHDTVTDYSSLTAALMALQEEDGRIVADRNGPVSLADGDEYVIELAPGLYTPNAEANGVDWNGAEYNHIREVTNAVWDRTPVMLMGVPGHPIGTNINNRGEKFLFGWITYGGPGIIRDPETGDGWAWQGLGTRSMDVAVNYEGETIHFGIQSFAYDGQAKGPHNNAGGGFGGGIRRAVIDSVSMGFTDGPGGSGSSSRPPFGEWADDYNTNSRAIVARTLICVSNDGSKMYGSGAFLMASNYLFGNGNAYEWRPSREPWGGTSTRTYRGPSWWHRDYLGQMQGSENYGHQRWAFYYNIASFGDDWMTTHVHGSYSSVMENAAGRIFGSEVAYNIVEAWGSKLVGPTGVSFQTDADTDFYALPYWDDGNTGRRFHHDGMVGYNIFVHRLDNRAPGWYFPVDASPASFPTGGSPSHPGQTVVFGNLTQSVGWGGGNSNQIAFVEGVTRLAEEQAAAPEAPVYNVAFPNHAIMIEEGDSWAPTFRVRYDHSPTAYAGTSVEGYIAASDFAAGTDANPSPVATWGLDGTGGPMLLTLEGQADHYIDLPRTRQEMLDHLGWDVPDGTAAGDPIVRAPHEDWTPPPFVADHEFPAIDPNDVAGTTGMDPALWHDHLLFVNTRVATRAVGTIVERVDGNGDGWRLELLSDFRPRFTLRDGGAEIGRITSRIPVEDGDRVALSVSGLHWHDAPETNSLHPRIAQFIWDHHYLHGNTAPLKVRVIAQATAPDGPFDTGPTSRVIWIDTSKAEPFLANLVMEWDGSGFVLAQGVLHSFVESQMTRWRFGENLQGRQFSGRNPVPDFDNLFWFGERRPDVMAAAEAEGRSVDDGIIFVYNTAESRVTSFRRERWTGTHWTSENRLERVAVSQGVLPFLRVGNHSPITDTDWVWPVRYNGGDSHENKRHDVPERRTIGEFAIPNHPLRLGAAATVNPTSGLELNYFEERRTRNGRAPDAPIDLNNTGVALQFGWEPLNTVTGERIYWGAPAVWSVSQAVAEVTLLPNGVTGTATYDGAGNIDVTITDPPEYAGTYTVAEADLDAGPVNIVPASATGGSEEGDTLTFTPGLWVGDGALTVLREIVRGEDTVVQSDFTDYTLTEDDVALGVTLRETAADSKGIRVNRSTAVPRQLPNYLQLSSTNIVDGSEGTSSKVTFAVRQKRLNMHNTSILRRPNAFAVVNHELSNREPRFYLMDTEGTAFFPSGLTGAGPMLPGADEWASYILTIDLDGELDGGAHVVLWINGVEWRHTLAGTGTGLMRTGRYTLGNAGNPVIEEFFLVDSTRAVEPSVLAPLLFDANNDYAARNIHDDPPLGPWEFFMAGPAYKWVGGVNMGFSSSWRLDNRVEPVTEVGP